MSHSRSGAALVALVWAAGCLVAQPPAQPRYFSPSQRPAVDSDAPHPGDGPSLRLRRVRAAAYLRERMVWRRGAEIGFYDLLRWTESPASYAQSWLEDELFDRRGLRRSSSPGVATLDVNLGSFDELLAPKHEAAVELDIVLSDPRLGTLVDRTIEARRPIASDDPSAIADALGAALADAAAQVGAAVADALGSRPP